MPVLDTCCCCVPLQSGVIVIGIIEMFLFILILFGCNITPGASIGLIILIIFAALAFVGAAKVIFLFLICLVLEVNFFFLLFHSIQKNRHLLLPYIITHVFACIIAVIVIFMMIFFTSAFATMIPAFDDKNTEYLLPLVIIYLTFISALNFGKNVFSFCLVNIIFIHLFFLFNFRSHILLHDNCSKPLRCTS